MRQTSTPLIIHIVDLKRISVEIQIVVEIAFGAIQQIQKPDSNIAVQFMNLLNLRLLKRQLIQWKKSR